MSEDCYIQVHLSGKLHPCGDATSEPYKPAFYGGYPFLQHVLWRCCNLPGIPSSMTEILLFNSVFHDRVNPVSVSTLKLLLGVIGVLPLKPRASPIISVCI